MADIIKKLGKVKSFRKREQIFLENWKDMNADEIETSVGLIAEASKNTGELIDAVAIATKLKAANAARLIESLRGATSIKGSTAGIMAFCYGYLEDYTEAERCISELEEYCLKKTDSLGSPPSQLGIAAMNPKLKPDVDRIFKAYLEHVKNHPDILEVLRTEEHLESFQSYFDKAGVNDPTWRHFFEDNISDLPRV